MLKIKGFIVILFIALIINTVIAEVPSEEKTSSLNKGFITNLMNLAEKCVKNEDYWLAEEIFSLVVLTAENKDETSKSVEKLREDIKDKTKNIEDNYREEDCKQSDDLYKSGMSFMKTAKYKEAIKSFEQALVFRKEFPEVSFKLGECYEKLKDNKKAIDYYRLSAKHLQQQANRSKESDELLTQTAKCLDRLDINWKQFSKIKNDYINMLLSLTNEYMKDKREPLVSQLLQQAVKIDPAHKKANEILVQIYNQPITDTEIARYSPNLFNGKDLTNWEATLKSDAYWRVENGKLIAEPPESKSANLMWKGRIPQNFSLYITCYIEPAKYKKTQLFGLYTGVYKTGRFTFENIFYPPAGRLIPGHNHIEYVMKNGVSRFVVNGRVTELSGMSIGGSSMDKPLIGIGVQTGCIYFEKIILAEFGAL